jgi:hypothetical protein
LGADVYVNQVKDSDGYDHQVIMQSEITSCAPASIYMVECIKKKCTMDGGEDRILYISNQFDGHLGGTTSDNMIQTLNACGIFIRSSASGRAIKLEERSGYLDNPALVIVNWDGGGYHCIVGRWFTDDGSRVVYLDPTLGTVQELPNHGRYTDGYSPGVITEIYYT